MTMLNTTWMVHCDEVTMKDFMSTNRRAYGLLLDGMGYSMRYYEIVRVTYHAKGVYVFTLSEDEENWVAVGVNVHAKFVKVIEAK